MNGTVNISRRGIYCVAFGDPARKCCERMIKSARRHLPEVPIMLCSDRPLGLEDLFTPQPDSDIGGRGAKLLAYELTPPEWESVLYLDADTEIVGDIRFYFQLVEDGWEFVICKDPMREDVAQLPRHKYEAMELVELEAAMGGTLHTLMLNGGVWAFSRGKRVAAFFKRWLAEWQKHAMRDQGALLRALYADPLKIYVLGNEWNFFPAYSSRATSPAGLMHYPGQARRWGGQIPGRLDSKTAWSHVKEWQAKTKQRNGR